MFVYGYLSHFMQTLFYNEKKAKKSFNVIQLELNLSLKHIQVNILYADTLIFYPKSFLNEPRFMYNLNRKLKTFEIMLF